MIENGQRHFYKIMLQSTSSISNTRYLKLSLSQTFSSFPSAPSVAALINSFDISNSAISSFHYVKLFSWSLQRLLGLFSIRFLKRFHFTHSYFERIHSKTLIEFLSFLISANNMSVKTFDVNQKFSWKKYFWIFELLFFLNIFPFYSP